MTTTHDSHPDPRAEGDSALRWRRRVRRWALDIAIVAGLYFLLSSWLERDLLDDDTPAPTFHLRDTSGIGTSLASLRGKKVVLHFWATWCGVCRQEFGALNSVQDNLDDDEVLVSIVADGDDPERIASFVSENEIKYPVLLGTEEVLAAFNISAFPTNYFVTPEGTVAGATRGISTRWGIDARMGCAR